MRFSSIVVLGIQFSSVISLPTRAVRSLDTTSSALLPRSLDTLPVASQAKREPNKEESKDEKEDKGVASAEKPAAVAEKAAVCSTPSSKYASCLCVQSV